MRCLIMPVQTFVKSVLKPTVEYENKKSKIEHFKKAEKKETNKKQEMVDMNQETSPCRTGKKNTRTKTERPGKMNKK